MERLRYAYLDRLAGKIRAARAQRGMTRAALAADSGVSLRFLAQLEAGQGNPSILVLRRIAAAMGFPPDALLSDEALPAGQPHLTQILKDCHRTKLTAARKLLAERFGGVGRAVRTRHTSH